MGHPDYKPAGRVPSPDSVTVILAAWLTLRRSSSKQAALFRELAEADRDGSLGPEAYARASERYGITWL